MADDIGIRFEVLGNVGRVHLDRPGSLNALTEDMCVAFHERLIAWRDDPRIGAVLISGEGERAFCTGGDIRQLYESGNARGAVGRRFFHNEFRLAAGVFHFPKPYVAVADGIVMGAGAGISLNGSHRIVTERTLFAMPETGIGLFPDVGTSRFLPRCPGRTGTYLGLTGARIRAADVLYVGIGTAYVPSESLAGLESALCEADLTRDAGAAIDSIIGDFAADPGPPPLARHREQLDRVFAGPSVAEIIETLLAEDGYWAIETADDLAEKSPTSLLVTFRALREGARLSFDEVIRMEYRLACAMLARHDFYEGIRAAVIDKDRNPRWRPARIADISPTDIDACFAAPEDGDIDLD